MVGLLRETARPCGRPVTWCGCSRAMGVLALLFLPGIRPAGAQSVTVASGAADRPAIILQHSVNINQTQQAVRVGESLPPSIWPGGTARGPGRDGRQWPAGSQASRRAAKKPIRRPAARRPAGGAWPLGIPAPYRPGGAFRPFPGRLPAFNFARIPVLHRPPPPAVTRPQPAASVPAVSHAPQPGVPQAGGNGAFESREVTLINRYRQQNGLNALAIDPNFSAIALGHSRDMANRNSMDHNGFDHRFAQARQYGATRCVENVAWNYNDPQSLFSAWQNSPEHNANMLDSAIRRAGVAIVNGYSAFFACN